MNQDTVNIPLFAQGKRCPRTHGNDLHINTAVCGKKGQQVIQQSGVPGGSGGTALDALSSLHSGGQKKEKQEEK